MNFKERNCEDEADIAQVPIHLIRNQRQMNLERQLLQLDYVYPIDENTQLELGYRGDFSQQLPLSQSLILLME